MAASVDSIAHALAPGVALTSAIFFGNGLTGRFSQVSGRIRELTREARTLDGARPERLESIRWQVGILVRRVHVVQRAVLVTYAAMIAFISTMVLLLASDLFDVLRRSALPFLFFALGLVCFTAALLMALWELSLATQTVTEDVRSSLSPAERRQ